MAITLLTGKPGAGKTLYLIDMILKEIDNKDDRPVYVCNLTGLLLKHEILEDARNWVTELPDGAFCIIDEVQEFWPNSGGFKVPDEVRALEKHRHRGIDFIIATQHPTQIPKHIRNLCEQHVHLHRPLGARFHFRYAYESVMENPISASSLKFASSKDKWVFRKAYYQMYKSTVKDTYKFRIPRQLFWIVPLFFGSLWFGYSFLSDKFGSLSPINEIENFDVKSSSQSVLKSKSTVPNSLPSNPLHVTPDWFISSVFCFSVCTAEFTDFATGRVYYSDYLLRAGYSVYFFSDFKSVEIYRKKTLVAHLFYFRPNIVSSFSSNNDDKNINGKNKGENSQYKY